jgi:hypothetical protein
MTYIFAILSVPLLTATGIYHPPVMRHGHCIAQPGSYDALYCQDTTTTQPHHRHSKK